MKHKKKIRNDLNQNRLNECPLRRDQIFRGKINYLWFFDLEISFSS